ncbi:hypothetical protein V0U79_12975 [Hyphobacterium sp. HN65]|uniref:Uncharacterized protein n=1 Tax=Hyphobacterium lacteum TaxID=3116575 RepID=A0ABU7LTP5_9PROT|nr:hypothetical protein [Hyphobacterium sp. HN65]MEE2527272.1 hypothetical protein [Hyphobacterium sp. HN65]
MIEIALALLIQTAPLETVCDLDIKTAGLSRARRVVEADVACHENVPGRDELNQLAERYAGRLNTRRLRSENLLTSHTALFSRGEAGGWEPVPGQVVITVPYVFPRELIDAAVDTVSCSWSAYPDRTGAPRNVRATCYVDGRVRPRNHIRQAERAVEDMVRQTRFFPADVDYCFQDEVRVVAPVIEVTGGRYNNDNDIEPDMRPLPQLCG